MILKTTFNYFQAKILYNIAVAGKYEEIPDQFFKTIEKSEPSPNLFVQWSSAISRTCGQHKTIINECIRAMQIAVDFEPSVNNKLELAYQTYLSGQYKEAIKLYDDLSNVEPIPKVMEGIILCHIEMNDINVQVNVFYVLHLSYLKKKKIIINVIFRLKNKLNC